MTDGLDPFGDFDPFGGSEPSLADGGMSRGSSVRERLKAKASEIKASDKAAKAIEAFAKIVERAGERIANRIINGPGGGTSGGPDTNPAVTRAMSASANLRQSGGPAAASGAGMGGGYFRNFMGGLSGNAPYYLNPSGGAGISAGYAAAGAGSAIIGAIDSRTNQMYGKSLSYDKLSVLYQQTQNVTQQQFVNRFITPLMSQRLGTGGAATLLGLQAQTGLSANLNASSVAAMQAATGYMYNTQDMSQAMATLASPMVNNRMTMTLGTGMYGPGGRQRSMMQVMQQVVQGAGLTNEAMVKSGMQIGSMTRAKLSALGLPEDMQNMILQYAQENINYQKKGGRGMYDPSRASDRKLMGIEKNFSTQEQETQRVREQRDVSFYKKQADNYSDLERQTQSLTRAMQKLEESMSGLIGARMKTRNNVGLQAAKFVGGLGLTIAGGMMSSAGVGVPIAGLGIGLMSSAASSFTGGAQSDPMPGSTTSTNAGQRRVTSQMDSVRGISKLNPKFKSRIQQMLNDNPNVGIGDGHRDSVKQRNLFLSRYSKTKEKTGIFWEGSYWKKNPGVPDATPPGMSMHEVGLAVDLTGDLKWVEQNASKYGLKTFATDGEPWHVQPAELPNDRIAYEKGGARWGLNGAQPLDKRTFVEGLGGVSAAGEGVGSGGMAGATQTGVAASGKASGTTSGMRKPNYISPSKLVTLLYNAGFRGRDLEAMAGIATRETAKFNANALNPRGRDYSFGLYQINMKNDDPANRNMGTQRLKMFGISKPEDLYDPATNIKAAKILFDAYKQGGKNPFQPWLGSHNARMQGKDAHWFDYRDGVQVLEKAGWARSGGKGTHDWKPITKGKQGDPMPVQKMSSQGGNTVVIDGGGTITISPTIQLNSASSTVDAHKVAQEAARIIERDLKVALMRKA